MTSPPERTGDRPTDCRNDPKSASRFGRRAFLGAAVATGGALAGCVTGSGGSFRLNARAFDVPLAEAFLRRDPTSLRAKFSIDYPAAYKREVWNELVETGSVTVVNYPLANLYDFGGRARESPSFLLDDDGTYLRVHVERSERITRTLWEFYLDLVDGDVPDDANPSSTPMRSLSDRDRLVLREALESAAADRTYPIDVAGKTPGARGVVYHRGVDPDASELVPTPPFDFLRHRDHVFRARAKHASVPLTRRVFTTERVADSPAGYVTYLRNHVLDADFDEASLSEAERSVLEAATREPNEVRSPFYEEDPPMSDGLHGVLKRLNADGAVKPYDAYRGYTDYPSMYGLYSGQWHRFELTVFPGPTSLL